MQSEPQVWRLAFIDTLNQQSTECTLPVRRLYFETKPAGELPIVLKEESL